MLKIRFLDVSMQVPFQSHLFVEILRQHFDSNIKIVNNLREEVDIEFVSNKTNSSDLQKLFMRMEAKYSSSVMLDYEKQFKLGFRQNYKTRARKRVWFTGENLRFPFGTFDLTFSFDLTDSLSNNVFFPYWLYRCNWFNKSNKSVFEEKIEVLLSPRNPELRTKCAVTFSSNYEPIRTRILAAVQSAVQVDCYGHYFGNFVKSKMDTSVRYGLQVCNENDFYPNYVTEKLQEAWIARNVPIWAGLDTNGYFNSEAIIDVTNLSSALITERVKNITIDEIMYRQSLPLLVKQPNLNEAVESFSKLLKEMIK